MPSYETNCIEDWETKLNKIVDETIKQDMTLISGIPPWMQMYFDWLQEKNPGKTIRQLFPNLQVLVYGGVNFEPYRAKLMQSIGETIDTLETFPASEGFFAFQDQQGEKGLLLYLINTHQNSGDGSIMTQSAVVTKGQSKSMYGWQFSVMDSNQDGVLIEVTKTDVGKFVPPPPKQNNPTQLTSLIRVSRGEVVPDGFLKAKATWNVTGHESYRLYVTDPVDFQKVYFETGYVNDSRTPIVVEIKGLVCNKEFRTMTEFYTKQNGQGEKAVFPSFQLRNLSCEDTTKKP
jgi:hypothetical protein